MADKLIIAQIRFGQSHVVTALGDRFKGKQQIDLACTPGIEISEANQHRYRLSENTNGYVACPNCRRITGLDAEEQDAD